MLMPSGGKISVLSLRKKTKQIMKDGKKIKKRVTRAEITLKAEPLINKQLQLDACLATPC
jgi:hypothetical protein